ncbi:MAG: hypothetical protein JRI61_11785, partial [Deltaproteobacteria bacterium]|nr:hypothetical protein [Deltaproteobacteria bacterium]
MNNIRVFKLNLILLVALAFFINGCASFKQNMMVKTAKMMRGFGKKAINRYPDAEQLRQAMPVMIVQSDMFLEMAPDDPELLLGAAELNGGYAMFLRKTDKARAVKYYKKSRDYSLRILKQNPVFNEALDKSDDEYVKALQKLDKEDVPALFTLLTSTFGWISTAQEDKPRALAELTTVESIIEKIL